MPSSRERQLRRDHLRAERRRAADEPVLADSKREQAIAAARKSLAAAQRRHRIAYGVWIVAALIIVGHFFEHANTIRIMSPGLEDLLIGWPMGGMLAIVGGIIYGP